MSSPLSSDHGPSLGRGADWVKLNATPAIRLRRALWPLQQRGPRSSVTAAVGKAVHVRAAHIRASPGRFGRALRSSTEPACRGDPEAAMRSVAAVRRWTVQGSLTGLRLAERGEHFNTNRAEADRGGSR